MWKQPFTGDRVQFASYLVGSTAFAPATLFRASETAPGRFVRFPYPCSEDPDGDALGLAWDVSGETFVDGTSASDDSVRVEFLGSSPHTTSLDVSGGRGGRASVQFTLGLGTGLTRFQQDHVEALFLGSGRLIPQDGAVACMGALGRRVTRAGPGGDTCLVGIFRKLCTHEDADSPSARSHARTPSRGVKWAQSEKYITRGRSCRSSCPLNPSDGVPVCDPRPTTRFNRATYRQVAPFEHVCPLDSRSDSPC